MAFENIGIGGVLTFNSGQAVANMNNVSAAATKMSGSFGKFSMGLSKIGPGLNSFAMSAAQTGLAFAPMSAAFYDGMNTAAEFEQQMSAIRAIAVDATKEDMKAIEAQAKQLGATTKFTAVEAGKAQENLARAGLQVVDIMGAMPGVMNAAAADGMGLADASRIISSTLNSMALDAKEAVEVTDTLAYVSAKTDTDLRELGVALTYSTAQAKQLGIPYKDLAAILGVVSDAGIRASSAGTSFTQAMIKLVKPTEDGAESLYKWGIRATKLENGGLDIINIMEQIRRKMAAMTVAEDRAKMMFELFGVRGQKAVNAIQMALEKGKLQELRADLEDVRGAAERMAQVRLDNLLGSMTLLKSATEGFKLEAFSPFLKNSTSAVRDLTKFISDTVLAMQELNDNWEGVANGTYKFNVETNADAVALGVLTGLQDIRDTLESISNWFSKTFGAEGQKDSKKMLADLTRIGTVLFGVMAILGPILIGISGVAFVVTKVLLPAFAVMKAVTAAAFWPVTLAIGAIIVGFSLLRKEGESVTDTLGRLWDNIKAAGQFLYDEIIMPVYESLKVWGPMFAQLGEVLVSVWNYAKEAAMSFLTGLWETFKALSPILVGVLKFVGHIIAFVAYAAANIATLLVAIFGGMYGTIMNVATSVMDGIVGMIKWFSGAIAWLGEKTGVLGEDTVKSMKEFQKKEFSIKGVLEKDAPGKGVSPEAVVGPDPLWAGPLQQTAEEKATAEKEAASKNSDEAIAALTEALKGQKQEINVNSKLAVNGKVLGHAVTKHQKEVSDRSGFKATPWARRAMAEAGSLPIGSK